MNFLTEQQERALNIVKNIGFETVQASVLTDYSRKYGSDVVAVIATKDEERFCVKVSTKKSKILAIEQIVIAHDKRDPTGYTILWVKKFSQPISKFVKGV